MDKFFEDLTEKWLAWKQRTSIEVIANVIHVFFGAPPVPERTRIADYLRNLVDPIILGEMAKRWQNIKQKPDDSLLSVYTAGGGWDVLKICGIIVHWNASRVMAPEEYLRAQRLGVVLCYAAAETPEGDEILNFETFFSLYVGFTVRFWMAFAYWHEIIRRSLRSRFQAWVLDSAFEENPKASYRSFLDEATREVGKENEDFVSDYMTGALDFLKNSPEHEAIKAALEQRFSEVGFFRDFLDHKKKAETRFHDQMESYREEPEEDEQGRPLPQSSVDIVEVLESFSGIGQDTAQKGQGVIDIPFALTEEQKSALNERIGPLAADIIECMGMSPVLAEGETRRDVKYLNECAEERGISQDTMTRYKKLLQENADWVTELLDLK